MGSGVVGQDRGRVFHRDTRFYMSAPGRHKRFREVAQRVQMSGGGSRTRGADSGGVDEVGSRVVTMVIHMRRAT